MPRTRRSLTTPSLLAVLILVTAIGGADAASSTSGLAAARARLREAARRAGVPYPLQRVRLVVWKSARVMALYSRDVVVRAYWVGLGFDPWGHKQREGDGKTPEGDYYLCTKYGASRFHRFLGISYPSPADAWAAYEDGRIGASTRRSITNVRSPNRPPWNTPLGGAIGVHGGGAGADWTLGCIALENEDVDEIWGACSLGTPITILP